MSPDRSDPSVSALGAPAAAPASRRKGRTYAVVAAVLVAALGAGAWAVLRDPPEGQTQTNGPTVPVTLGPLIVSVTESGEVTAEKRKVISNEIRYPVIIKSLVEEGDRVKKGQTIITFECRELLNEIENKKLVVTNAKNAYLQAVESVQLDGKEQDNLVRKAVQAVLDANDDLRRYIEAEGPMGIADANAGIHTARRDLALAEEKLNFKLKVNADQELNSPFSENEIEAEKLSVEKLKISLGKAIATYGKLVKYDDPRERRTLRTAVEDAKLARERARHTAKSKVLTSEAERETKKIGLDLQTRQLDELLEDEKKLVVTAEEEGLVVYDVGGNRWRPATDARVEVGAKISPRQQLMIIPDMTTLLIKTKVYEAIIDQVDVGLKAYVRLDARPDSIVPGHVAKVGVLPDSQHRWLNPGVKVFKVDIELDQKVPDLKPGMTAQVEIELERLGDVLSVPVATVFTEQEKTCCYRVTAGHMERVEVKVGKMNDSRVQIVSGLREGDHLLLTPPASVEKDDKADDALRKEAPPERSPDELKPPDGPKAPPKRPEGPGEKAAPPRGARPDRRAGDGRKPPAGRNARRAKRDAEK